MLFALTPGLLRVERPPNRMAMNEDTPQAASWLLPIAQRLEAFKKLPGVIDISKFLNFRV